ncbi:MAG: ribonuclease R, partial [Lachnospiraceae bacterium]|nr:ribonuclease R [Lachnospiraceae bacterium]
MDIKDKRKKVICDLVNDPLYVPMKEKELAMFLQVSKEDREIFHQILTELLEAGELMLTLKGKYMKSNGKVLTGTFISNAKGYGFVEIEGRDEDLFVPEDKQGGAFHKDTVQVALLPPGKGKRQEAQVIRILARGITQLVGTYEQSRNNYGFVIPDNTKLPQDIFVPKERSKGAMSGHKVVVEITGYGTDTKSPEGKIVEILGHINDPGVDIMSIVRSYELPVEFGEKIMNQVERVSQEVSEADCAGRRDLREVTMVTIDGEDAKDLDDAVSVSFDGTHYHLGVHIADVTNYVQENSALDREALRRGTSVYLVDRVIPMLPHALSNGICSLNEGVDRLALSCLMRVDKQGEIVDYEICESVIRVNQRMSYTAVKAILQDESIVEKEEEYQKYAVYVPMFQQMEELATLLRTKRRKRGSIDFDFPECKIILDKEGHPLEIKPYDRNVATRMIEDFMLAANETVAEHFFWQELPFVYRVHAVPDEEKIQKLSTFINNFGYYMKTVGKNGSKVGSEEIHPKEIQKLLDKIAGTPEEAMISRLALRSMKQAKYSEACTGHFGLACKYYCHFTSPIRRYPDLQIHRIIKEQLRGRLKEERVAHYQEIIPQVAKHSSEMERRADEAERETDKLKKVEYMQEHIGEVFDGVVSGITSWGIYVELPNTIEGMVHISKLPGDYYYYNESINKNEHALYVGGVAAITNNAIQNCRVSENTTLSAYAKSIADSEDDEKPHLTVFVGGIIADDSASQYISNVYSACNIMKCKGEIYNEGTYWGDHRYSWDNVSLKQGEYYPTFFPLSDSETVSEFELNFYLSDYWSIYNKNYAIKYAEVQAKYDRGLTAQELQEISLTSSKELKAKLVADKTKANADAMTALNGKVLSSYTDTAFTPNNDSLDISIELTDNICDINAKYLTEYLNKLIDEENEIKNIKFVDESGNAVEATIVGYYGFNTYHESEVAQTITV